MHPFLLISLIGAVVFLVLQPRPFFKARPVIKAVMATALAAYCLAVPQPPLWIMAAGFMLSALGDFLLDWPDDKYFLPGLIAFLCAHLAFIIALAPYVMPVSDLAAWQYAASAALIGISIIFYGRLYKALPAPLRLPVLVYTGVIALMGLVTLNTALSAAGVIITGAILFILSDMILATARFIKPFKGHMHLNWLTYSLGQILLAIGVVYALKCGICIPEF